MHLRFLFQDIEFRFQEIRSYFTIHFQGGWMLVPFGAHFIFEIYSPLPRLQRIQAVRCLSNWITRIIIILIEVSVQLPNGHPAMSTGVNAFSYECKELLLHPQTLSSNRILYSHGCLHSISTAMLRRSVDVAGVRKIDGERERERFLFVSKQTWNNCRIGVSYERQCHAHDWQK